MADPKHVEIVEQGADAINQWRAQNPGSYLDLTDASITQPHREHAPVHIYQADLSGANLSGANLTNTDFCQAYLDEANLSNADLTMANLADSYLQDAVLRSANLTGANLINANLTRADLTYANLTNASLCSADLWQVNLDGANLTNTDFTNATCGSAYLLNIDLSSATGLESIRHAGSNSIDGRALSRSKGRVPAKFLQGCGLNQWEILQAQLYNPTLSPADIAELQQQIFNERTKGFFLGGVFISYSREDTAPAEKLYSRLQAEGANVWLDTRDIIAGPLQRQVERAIRINDIYLIVLSEHSINSPWVDAELEWALDKEDQEKRDVLCPIALDDTWKEKAKHDIQWRRLKKKAILDFSEWDTPDAFNSQFQKLIEGIKVWYGPDPLTQ